MIAVHVVESAAKVGTPTPARVAGQSHFYGGDNKRRLNQPMTLVRFGKINNSVVAKRMSPA